MFQMVLAMWKTEERYLMMIWMRSQFPAKRKERRRAGNEEGLKWRRLKLHVLPEETLETCLPTCQQKSAKRSKLFSK